MEKIKKSLSFVMAGYNEEDNVIKAVSIVNEVLAENIEDYEIILVDDGSKDNTLSLMKQMAEENHRIRVLENKVNLNYGAAVLRGLMAAKKDWVVYDAFDLEMHPKDFVRFYEKLDEKYEVVVFERITYDAVKWRRFASKLNLLALNVLYPVLMRGTPVLNHTQMFKRSIIPDIIPKSRSPIFFSPEMVFRAKLKKYKWINVKIKFFSLGDIRPGAFGHIYDMLWAIQDMLRFRIMLWKKEV